MQCYTCRKYFKNKQESWTTCKKAIIFFGDLLKISTFRRLLQNPTTKLPAIFSRNHILNPWALNESKRGKNAENVFF